LRRRLKAEVAVFDTRQEVSTKWTDRLSQMSVSCKLIQLVWYESTWPSISHQERRTRVGRV